MKKFLLAMTLATFGLVGGNYADQPDGVVYPTGEAAPTDPELKDLQWNRYTTTNFTILSIDDGQGRWLAANMESIKMWCVTRWGFPDFKFTTECKVVCVPNRKLMKKLFNLTESKYEVRRKDGRVEASAMWLILDDKPAMTIPVPLSHICFAEFQARHQVKMGCFAHHGMSLLNGTIPEIRARIGTLATRMDSTSAEKMLSITEEDYVALTPAARGFFDSQAMVLCLLLRKEFGEAKMQGFLRMSSRNSPQAVLQKVYRFRDFRQFDESYSRYTGDLTREVLASRTPDSYLNIRPVK